MQSQILTKGYYPQEIEAAWASFWLSKDFFQARLDTDRDSFSMVIPPPNVTGSLHMGHALNNTLQDILARFWRMQGSNVLWLPGTDHAGIATQNVVEKILAGEGKSRHTLGREEFSKRVWDWKEKYGHVIVSQLKRLGASCDWSRERFTLDEGFSRAVRSAFVQLYKEGLIYRGDYVINWCPRCRTALSDLETELEQVTGELYFVDYPRVDGQGALTVATTRPETILGDVAVAFNPSDERYRGLLGQRVRLPLIDKVVPVIADEVVKPEFGTGLLKITPAHDFDDFQVSLRHKLPRPRVMDEDGRMNEQAGPYQGLDRGRCRQVVVDDLGKAGLLRKVERYTHTLGHCYRCKTVVEPYLSKQWFVKTGPLAQPAIAAVQRGETKIIPSSWEKTYFDWMDNIRDWCISRQIWWGHRIPAWHCASCQEIMVDEREPIRCSACGQEELRQEDDVLDTWFSSALWPFASLGWPDNTPELAKFYPTSCLVTGFDILFFWVARMMMMGLKFTGQVPFREVYIHALVRDAEGQKMSKSRGNVIDPVDMSEKYGTDAFRFTLAAMAVQGRDIKLSPERIAGYRHFANKIWNAARFILMNLEGVVPSPEDMSKDHLDLADRWILSRLKSVVQATTAAFKEYRFSEAANLLYQFIWHEFCDWYLEAVKPALSPDAQPERRAASRGVLCLVLEAVLRLLHPIMPFITEELWQKLPHQGVSISVASYPDASTGLSDDQAEKEMALIMDVVGAIRNLKGELGIPPAYQLEATLMTEDASTLEVLRSNRDYLITLARLKGLDLVEQGSPPPSAVNTLADGVEIFVPLAGVIDFTEELKRLGKERGKLEKELTRLEAKLANEGFRTKAAEDVVAREQQKFNKLGEKREKIIYWEGKVAQLIPEKGGRSEK